MKSLYNKLTLFGRLYEFFLSFFGQATRPTAHKLALLVMSMIAMSGARSVKFLYEHFLNVVDGKGLSSFYHALSYARVSWKGFMSVTARLALGIIREPLADYPVFLLIDDTIIPKAGRKFDGVGVILDHSLHGGNAYLNGHCFVSLMICVPTLSGRSVVYRSFPLGYSLHEKDGKSKISLATDMVRSVMPSLAAKRNVVILCDSWYAVGDVFALTKEFDNLGVIAAAKKNLAMYDMPPEHAEGVPRRRGRPRSRGGRVYADGFPLSEQKEDDFHLCARKVFTNLLPRVPVAAFVTATDHGSRRLFVSTVSHTDLSMCCSMFKDKRIRNITSENAVFLPLFLYSFRWNIEVGYYEQKTFWSLCSYMVRKAQGIEMMVNLVNVAYAGLKLLPFVDASFAQYAGVSVQEFRFALSQGISNQLFIASFESEAENGVNSHGLLDALTKRFFQKAA